MNLYKFTEALFSLKAAAECVDTESACKPLSVAAIFKSDGTIDVHLDVHTWVNLYSASKLEDYDAYYLPYETLLQCAFEFNGIKYNTIATMTDAKSHGLRSDM